MNAAHTLRVYCVEGITANPEVLQALHRVQHRDRHRAESGHRLRQGHRARRGGAGERRRDHRAGSREAHPHRPADRRDPRSRDAHGSGTLAHASTTTTRTIELSARQQEYFMAAGHMLSGTVSVTLALTLLAGGAGAQQDEQAARNGNGNPMDSRTWSCSRPAAPSPARRRATCRPATPAARSACEQLLAAVPQAKKLAQPERRADLQHRLAGHERRGVDQARDAHQRSSWRSRTSAAS